MPRSQEKAYGPLRLFVLLGVTLGVIAILVLGEVRTYKNRDEAMASIRKEGGAVILGEPKAERSPWQFRTWIQSFFEDHHVSAARVVQYQLRNDEDLRRILALDEMTDLTLVGDTNTSLLSELNKLPMLETLTLRSAVIDANAIAGLKDLLQLKKLFLGDCNFNIPMLHALAELPIELSLLFEDQTFSDDLLVALSKCDNLRRLQFDKCDIDNEKLQKLKGSIAPVQLAMNGSQVTTSGLASILSVNNRWTIELQSIDAPRRDSTPPNRFPSAESITTQARLDFAGPCVDDALFDCIEQAQDLQSLGLNNCSVTDIGFARLMAFTKLKQLSVASKQLTDEGLRNVGRLSQLQYLFLNSGSIRGEGFASLPASIESLTLRTPLAEPSSLAKLSHLNSLQELTLEGVNFTDQSLDSLPSFPQLKQLTLYETTITEQSVAKFKARHPSCRISND